MVRQLPLPAVAGHDLFDPGRVLARLPFITLLLLAALQTVPNEVIESSRIDGASSWQTTRHITIPLILPTMVVRCSASRWAA